MATAEQVAARKRNLSILFHALGRASKKMSTAAARGRLDAGTSTRVVATVDAQVGRAQFNVSIDGDLIVGVDVPKKYPADKNRLLAFLLSRLGAGAGPAMAAAVRSIDETGELPAVDSDLVKLVGEWLPKLTVDGADDDTKNGPLTFDGTVDAR